MINDDVLLGAVVAPAGIIENGWVAMRAGKIADLGAGTPPPAMRVFDASNALILPGIIDGQTHAGSYRGLEGIRSTTRSAVAGGVTTIVDMPYDHPAPLDSIARLDEKKAAIAAHAHAHVAVYATVMPGQDTEQVRPLIDAGIVAFKISSVEFSATRFPRIPADQMLALFEALADTGLPLGIHNEDAEIVRVQMAKARAAGHNDILAHSASRPLAAELSSTAHFLELGANVPGAHAHIVHLSSARGFQLVEQYRGAGFHATGEMCVHYLWFDPERGADYALGARMKVNPPIRPGQIDALWNELSAGRVAFVSSDHSSWPIDNKLTPSIFDAGSGVPGLETLLPAFYTGAAQRGLDAARLSADYLAERPARFFGLWPRKGALRPGADADVTILSREPHVWDEALAHDELNWSPYHGRQFDCRVTRTYVAGKLAWDGVNIINAPGDGVYAPRQDNPEDQ
jgi:allantoinase